MIGQEFAAIFSALGSKVTVVEVLDRILSEVDTEIARRYASLLPGLRGQYRTLSPGQGPSKKQGTFSEWFTRKETKKRSAKLTRS